MLPTQTLVDTMHSFLEVSWLTGRNTGVTIASSATNTKFSIHRDIDIPAVIPTPGSVKKALWTIRTLQKAIAQLISSLDALIGEASAHRAEMEGFDLPHPRQPACSTCRASYIGPGPSRLMCRNSPGHDPSHVVDHHRLFLDNMRAELLWLGRQHFRIGGGFLWWVALLGDRLCRSRVVGGGGGGGGDGGGGKLSATIAYWARLEVVVKDYDWVWGCCWKGEEAVDCWEAFERACKAAENDAGGLYGVNFRMRDYSTVHADRVILNGPVIHRWPKVSRRRTVGDSPVPAASLQENRWGGGGGGRDGALGVDPRLRRLPSEIPVVDLEEKKEILSMENVLAIVDRYLLPESVKRRRRRKLKRKGKMPAL